MKQFECSGCNSKCIVTVPEKSRHSKKRKPDECIFGIYSLVTNENISKWKIKKEQD